MANLGYVRTIISKVNEAGIMEPEKRGGRHKSYKEIDEKLCLIVKEHIDRFSRMESHYCRINTSNQYLLPCIAMAKLHNLYQREHTNDTASI